MRIKRILGAVLLVALPVLVFVFSLGIGAYRTEPSQVIQAIVYALSSRVSGENAALSSLTGDAIDQATLGAQIIVQVRFPRLLAALLVGAALGCSGAVFQGLFRNPLASPYTLGVSNGAGFGAALAILWGWSQPFVQASAVFWGLCAVSATYLLSQRAGSKRGSTLVLTGVLVGSLFASLVSLIKFMADPTEKLPQITYWLMGSLSQVSLVSIVATLPLYVVSLGGIFYLRWRLNVLSLGDEEACSYGVNVPRDRAYIILFTSVLTALSVSVAGVIGWVGIVVPHIARLIVGPDYRRLLPASLAMGMTYLMVIDNLCRSLSATEIPLGVVTGIIGAPLFAYVLATRKVGW